MPKKQTILMIEVTRAGIDPVQYKPYSPNYNLSNEYQRTFIPFPVPEKYVLFDGAVGKGKDKHREVHLSVDGLMFVCKRISSLMAQFNATGGAE